MPSLSDIGELTDTVEVRGKTITIEGVSAEGIVYLLGKFPELRQVMTGTADENILQSLVGKLPKAVASIIAVATGKLGDAREEELAAKLPVSVQLELLTKIWKLTFTRGVRDFLDALEALASEVDVESGKGPDTKSPGQSSGASEMDIPLTLPGDTPLGSLPLGKNSVTAAPSEKKQT
jgi:hypothetical protein